MREGNKRLGEKAERPHISIPSLCKRIYLSVCVRVCLCVRRCMCGGTSSSLWLSCRSWMNSSCSSHADRHKPSRRSRSSAQGPTHTKTKSGVLL